MANSANNALPQRPRVALGSLVDLRISGVDKKSKPAEVSVRLCNYTDVYYSTVIRNNMSFMEATATDNEIDKCTLYAGDVVITKDSEQYNDIGVPAFVMDDVPDLVCGYHLAILRPETSRLHGRYLYYALCTHDIQSQFHCYANGSTRFGLRKIDIGLIKIPLPGLNEQYAIANILGSLDDKIEMNRRMNQTLERMVRLLFKSWFVDYDPVHAKIAKQVVGLPAHISKLFPNKFDEEHKPYGWSLDTLTTLAKVNPESWVKSEIPKLIEYVDLGNTKWGTIKTTQRFHRRDAPSSARRILRPGDTIVGRVRPGNGSFAFIGANGLTGSTAFAVLRPNHIRDKAFVFLAATAPENLYRLAHLADGSCYPSVSPSVVGASQVTVPDNAIMSVFSDLATPVLDKIESSKRQNDVLARIRDLLLPKLISGQIQVKQAKQVLREVL